jgi:hypothetical protein
MRSWPSWPQAAHQRHPADVPGKLGVRGGGATPRSRGVVTDAADSQVTKLKGYQYLAEIADDPQLKR